MVITVSLKDSFWS